MMNSMYDTPRVLLQRLAALVAMVSLLSRWHSVLAQNIPTYYLDDYCSKTLDMTMANVKSGRLMLHRPGQTPIYTSCHMLIAAPTSKRLSFKFHSFDIVSPLGCTSSFLRIYEDHQRKFPITDKFCNSGKAPDRAYITNGEQAAVWINKENYMMDQVELIFTAFSFSPCVGGDYQCHNDHCIARDLYCNDPYDNCGDESDICLIQHATVVGIIVAVVILVVIIAILLALYMFRRQRKIRREKVANLLFVSPTDQKSQLSLVGADGKSSTLRSSGSTMARYPGIRTIAFTGTKAHSLSYQPLVFTGSPTSSRYSTLTRNGHGGGVLVSGSNLGEKARSSIRSKPWSKSTSRYVEPSVQKTSSVRQRPPGELRPPFYFDKDGYFSDSSASQTNSLDNKHGRRRSSLDATDARKKKKKFMGRSKKKSKKAETAAAVEEEWRRRNAENEYGFVNRAYSGGGKEGDLSGWEQMTEDLYIDGRQLVSPVHHVPEIRVTQYADGAVEEQAGRNRTMSQDRTRDTPTTIGHSHDNYNQPVNNSGLGEFPAAGTSVRSAEALNQLLERRKAASEEARQTEVSSLKIDPRRKVTARAVVHHMEDAATQHTSTGLYTTHHDDDRVDYIPVVETTVVETSSSPGRDGGDQSTIQSPTHISVLTLPEKPRHDRHAHEEMETTRTRTSDGATRITNGGHDDGIETVVIDTPSSIHTGGGYNNNNNNNNNNTQTARPHHVSVLNFPGASSPSSSRVEMQMEGSGGKQKWKSSPNLRSGGEEEDEMDGDGGGGYPRTNLQLAADQTLLTPTTMTSNLHLDPNSPRSSSSSSPAAARGRRRVRSVSPTRQMGLNARHPDGSPYTLHEVSQKSVARQARKKHPEHRADVRDHVISFRSYPSPVHSLERAGLFRHSSRRTAGGYSDTNK